MHERCGIFIRNLSHTQRLAGQLSAKLIHKKPLARYVRAVVIDLGLKGAEIDPTIANILKQQELTIGQGLVFDLLSRQGRMTAKEISNVLNRTLKEVKESLQFLITQGIVEQRLVPPPSRNKKKYSRKHWIFLVATTKNDQVSSGNRLNSLL